MQSKKIDNGTTWAVIGSSGCGKSTMVKKIHLTDLYQSETKDKEKEYIRVVFTESALSDAFDDLPKDVMVDKHGVDPDMINFCYNMNLKYDKKYNFVLVLDDCIHIRYQKMIEKMFLIMRNMNITSIVSLQYPKLIPPSIRSSVYFTFCMSMNNMEVIETVVRGWMAGYLEGQTIRQKMDTYRAWTESGGGHRFYMIDNLNHRCFKVDEHYMCEELFMIDFATGGEGRRKRKRDDEYSVMDKFDEKGEVDGGEEGGLGGW